MSAEVRVATFAELTPLQLYRILKLRSDVFVVEQDCVYPDIDDRDLEPGAQHLWIEQDDDVVAYLPRAHGDAGRRVSHRSSRHRRNTPAARVTRPTSCGGRSR